MKNPIGKLLYKLPSEDAFKIKPRIVNGQTAVERQFPFYVYLNIRMVNMQLTCGGALLNDQFILTAAHCLINATAIDVHLGTADLYSPHDVIRVKKDNIIQYPKFDRQMRISDIGLIKLPNKVEFTKQIQPIRLPVTCEMAGNRDVVIMGNGRFDDAVLEGSSELQYATLKMIPFESCLKTFPYLLPHKRLHYICAVDQENTGRFRSSICYGDSGSPLTKSDGTLLGVTSIGPRGGCETGEPQIFTRVSSYTKWINKVTGLNLPEC